MVAATKPNKNMPKKATNTEAEASTENAEKSAETKTAPKVKVSQIKKLTNKEFVSVAKGDPITIAGIVRGFEPGEGIYGPYTKFTGDFAARFVSTILDAEGEKTGSEEKNLRSTRLFLPSVAEEMLMNAVGDFLSEDRDIADLKKSGGISFCLKLVKVHDPDPKNARGWQWTVEPVGEFRSESERVGTMLAEAASS